MWATPMRNRTIENPIIGDRVTFVRTSAETGGAYSEIVVELSAGGGNEPHYHTQFAESFSPIEGDLGVLVGTERRTIRPGETATVEPGIVHCFFNATDEMVTFKGEARPGHEGLERFAQIAYGLARDGNVNKKGYPNKLAHIAILMEMGDVRIPGLAFKLMGPIFRWIARRARSKGIEQQLIDRYCT